MSSINGEIYLKDYKESTTIVTFSRGTIKLGAMLTEFGFILMNTMKLVIPTKPPLVSAARSK